MKSASAYTNARRVTAIGKNTKVEYPKYVAKNWGLLQPAVRCNPNFDILIYKDNCRCEGNGTVFPITQPSVLGSILDGGEAPIFTPEFTLEGSGSTEPSPEYVLDGGSS
jgi:hypothetical protein